MEIRQLEQFLAIVEATTITAAAADLHISQPSLSQSLIAFERELGVALFTRRARSLELTAAGHALVDPSRRAIRAVKDAEQAVLAVSEVAVGTLEIAAPAALLAYPLAQLTQAFLARHPQVRVRVTETHGSDDASRRVTDGRAELALLDMSQCAPSLTRLHLVDYEISLVLPPSFPPPPTGVRVGLDYAVGLPLVLPPAGTVSRRLLESAVPDPDVRVETGSLDAIVAHVVRGTGAALLIAPYAQQAAAAGARVLPLAPVMIREICAAFRGDEPAPAARAFLSLARLELGPASDELRTSSTRVVN